MNSEGWPQLNNKIPDKALCFSGKAYKILAIIVEIGIL
jgi:hypothetical protein